MKHFICQFGDKCRECKRDIEKGEWAYMDEFSDNCVCEDCVDFSDMCEQQE